MAADGVRFVHVTDTHIMAGGKWPLRNGEFDTDASLCRVEPSYGSLIGLR